MLLAISALSSSLRAEPNVAEEMQRDVILRAMVDELERSRSGVHLEGLEKPYFIEYALVDGETVTISAKLGAITRKVFRPTRQLRTDVRVGSYELDNSNYRQFRFGGFGGRGGTAIPVEDDYTAIRQAIWWTTDRDYKSVVEALEAKKAFMKGKIVEDRANDFSQETPTAYFDDKRVALSQNVNAFVQMGSQISAVFRDYPEVIDSNVYFYGGAGRKYLVNTEGTRLREADAGYTLSISATVQADDGMRMSDSMFIYAPTPDELPDASSVIQDCRDMLTQLLEVKSAPVLESYAGPVLFEADAAVSVFAGWFAPNFAGGQRPLGSSSDPDDFALKLKKRILPRFLNVVDDPTTKTIAGEPVIGHYLYDDQGVPARRVNLVENGKLLALLMSRIPSKEFSHSTGHGRGFYGPTASVGCMMVLADPATPENELKQELLDACEDEGLEFGLRVVSMGQYAGGSSSRFWGGGGGELPLVMYKVFPDGREELVRGAEISGIDLKDFKDILAAGEKVAVYNSLRGAGGMTVAAPALLFEELNFAKIDRDFDKPPQLPSPLASKSDGSES